MNTVPHIKRTKSKLQSQWVRAAEQPHQLALYFFLRLYMQEQQITVSPSGKVYLNLPNKKYKPHRNIGDISGDTLHVYRNSVDQRFRQFGGSIGFNYELMRDGTFTNVVVHLPYGEELVTTRKCILDKGKFLHFKKNDLDRQIYHSLENFGVERAKECEEKQKSARKPKGEQPSLFGGVQ
jgi:hypothetical protein